MYDCIVLESRTLPSGVTLANVLDGCHDEAIQDVLQNISDFNDISQEDVEVAGNLQSQVDKPCMRHEWAISAL